MRKTKINKKMLALLAISCVALGTAGALSVASVRANAAEALTRPTELVQAATENETEFYMNGGASVRAGKSGIRFETYVTPAFHSELEALGTVTYFATAKADGKTEQVKEIPFSTALNEDGNYTLYTYINYDTAEDSMSEETLRKLYAQDFITSTFAKVEGEGGTVYYQAYSKNENEVVRSMRAVGNEAWLNWTEASDFQQDKVEKYFIKGARSQELTAYALDTGKVAFQMPGYTGTAESVSAYVGAEKYTAAYDAASESFLIDACAAKAEHLSIFDGDATVYSTKMGDGIEIRDLETLKAIKAATTGNYVLTADVDMKQAAWTWEATDPKVFGGTLDGNGHKIINFKSPQSAAGLIYQTGAGATIKNLYVHITTNGLRSGLIGQALKGGTIENVDIVCDDLYSDATYPGGVIANVIQGELTVKDTNIIIKSARGAGNARDGFIAVGESNSDSVIVENVVCYNPTALATTPYAPVNTTNKGETVTYGTFDKDGNVATPNEDYYFYNSMDALLAASKAGELSPEFADLLEEASVLTFITEDNIDVLLTATDGYYALTEDIDMKQKAWDPSVQFAGTLDGNGHKIINFKSPQNSDGLFYQTGAGATIKNLYVHMTTNGLRGGLIGQVMGATKVENVDIICDSLYNDEKYPGGTIANVIQGELTVKDANIVVKAVSGVNTLGGFIAAAESSNKNVIVSNVVCYNPSGNATTPYNPSNVAYGTYGTDGALAEANVDYFLYQSVEELQAATLTDEFKALLTDADISY